MVTFNWLKAKVKEAMLEDGQEGKKHITFFMRETELISSLCNSNYKLWSQIVKHWEWSFKKKKKHFVNIRTVNVCVLRKNPVDVWRVTVHSLTILCFNSWDSVFTHVTIMGFWEAHVRFYDLLPCIEAVGFGVEGGDCVCGRDNTLVKYMSDIVFRDGGV